MFGWQQSLYHIQLLYSNTSMAVSSDHYFVLLEKYETTATMPLGVFR
jgi:hypothetical protein